MSLPFDINQKYARNELCPCGSGKKYKTCCVVEHAKELRWLRFQAAEKKQTVACGDPQCAGCKRCERMKTKANMFCKSEQLPDCRCEGRKCANQRSSPDGSYVTRCDGTWIYQAGEQREQVNKAVFHGGDHRPAMQLEQDGWYRVLTSPDKSELRKQALRLGEEFTAYLECHFCQTRAKKLLKCGGCTYVSYCGTDCQKSDWEEHRTQCRKLARRKKELKSKKK